MKSILIVAMIFLLFSCDFGNKEETVIKILEQGNYVIEISSEGCMGSGVETLEIVNTLGNTNKAVYTYLDYSEPDGPHEKTKEIIWGKEKEIVLKEIFEVGVNKISNQGFCTTKSTFKLKKFPYAVKFIDSDCTFNNKFGLLIE